MISYSVLICTVGSVKLRQIVDIYLQDESDDYEILVVCDNPEMESDLIRSLPSGNPRLQIVCNRSNLGLTRSLNKGLEAARGEIILRNDDDDMPVPRRLKMVRDFFTKHADTDLLFSYAIGCDERGNRWGISGPSQPNEIQTKLYRQNFIVASSVAYRKSVVANAGAYNPAFRYAQDYELYLRLDRRGAKFACLEESAIERFYSPNSITVKKRKTQMLYSFAARLLHAAEVQKPMYTLATISQYTILFITPDFLRTVRRRLGFGR